LCGWVKELQLKPEELQNEVLLSKDKFGTTAWHKTAERSHVELLKKLWDWAKKLHLEPEELGNDMLLQKTCLRNRPGTRHQKETTLIHYRNCGIGLKNCS